MFVFQDNAFILYFFLWIFRQGTMTMQSILLQYYVDVFAVLSSYIVC